MEEDVEDTEFSLEVEELLECGILQDVEVLEYKALESSVEQSKTAG